MEFTYSTDIVQLHDQLESVSIVAKMSKRDVTVATLLGFVAYLRGNKLGFETDQDFAKALGVPKSAVSKGLTVIELGAPQLVAKNNAGFATPDESIVAVVEALVDAHNGKAVSGIYSALVGPQDKERRTLSAIVASMLTEAIAAGYDPSAIVEEVQAQLSNG